MAIPEISRINVLAAIEHIKKEGVPSSRQSTRYFLVHDDRRYPPKYVVSQAVKDATGRALDPQEFSGGFETNSLLRQMGFSVFAFSKDAVDTARTSAIPRESKRGRRQKGAKVVPVPSQTDHGVPLIGRVVVHGQPGGPADGEIMLLNVLTKRWPQGLHLKFLITPGGFVVAPFPTRWRGGVSWNSRASDLDALRVHAERILLRTVTERVLRAAEGKIDILTIGIDLSRDDGEEHAELVAVHELASRRCFWTGKSYPTSDQERHLVQVVDLSTHLLEIADERVLVLGCHDLNMFSPRSQANQSPGGVRRHRCEEMRKLTRQFKPTIVLHHPHSTDTPNIWRTAWGGLVKECEGLKAWASGIAFFRGNGAPRALLDKVLAATYGGSPSIDMVTKTR